MYRNACVQRTASTRHWSAQGGSNVASTPSVRPRRATPRATTARAESRHAWYDAPGPATRSAARLGIADDLVDRSLLWRESPVHRDRAGHVRRVAAPAGADVHHDHIARLHLPVVGLVVVLGRVRVPTR